MKQGKLLIDQYKLYEEEVKNNITPSITESYIQLPYAIVNILIAKNNCEASQKEEERVKAILTLMNLKGLEEELPKDKFMRVHRSFIVSLQAIDVIERGQIIIGNQRITVSENYKPHFWTTLPKIAWIDFLL